jgi:predicted RNA-binding protein with PUA-like domain
MAAKKSAIVPGTSANPLPAQPAYHLVKSEPVKYPWSQLIADGKTLWDGVRNFEARNKLRAMKLDERVLFYHSNEGKEIVGIAKVVREAYADPTSDEDWSVVDLAPVASLKVPVTLATIRAHELLGAMEMMRRNRLSVTTVTLAEYTEILRLGGLTAAP